MASENITLDELYQIVKGLQQNSPRVDRFDFPTNQTIQGRPSLASNMKDVEITVPDMRNYDLISISYHHNQEASSNTECQLIPIQELRDRKTIQCNWGYHYWESKTCVLRLTYVSDTRLKMNSGDASTAGIFSPMYFIKF